MTDDGGFTTVSTRIAYQNRWTRVREDAIRRPDGSPGLYGVVERSDFVVVFPLHPDGRVTLVEQFRYPVGRRLLELPMGQWEDRPDRPPEDVAAGELAEETGFVASDWVKIGILFQGPGYSTQKGHVFLARGLSAGLSKRENSEQDMVAVTVPLPDFVAMIGDGRIADGMTIAAYGLLVASGLLAVPPSR